MNMNTNHTPQEFRKTFNLDDVTLPLLEEMAWQDRKNASEFVRWLVIEEAKRRQVQPAAEAN